MCGELSLAKLALRAFFTKSSLVKSVLPNCFVICCQKPVQNLSLRRGVSLFFVLAMDVYGKTTQES